MTLLGDPPPHPELLAQLLRRNHTHTPNGHTSPNGTADLPPNLPADWWQARPTLHHIRQAAWSRNRSPDAVLACTLTRTVAHTPPSWRLPPTVGTHASLNLICAIVGAPGTGKSTAWGIATELAPAPEWVLDQLPLGTGEGLIEAFIGNTTHTDQDGNRTTRRDQIHDQACVWADEGDTITSLAGRTGATLLSTLRSAWSGQLLGQTNAAEERRRRLPAHHYRLCVALAIQPGRAAPLFSDTAGGLPQRITWHTATDPNLPPTPPDWPGPLHTPPAHRVAGLEGQGIGWHDITLPEHIATQIRAEDRARITGHTQLDDLDGHATLARLKLAAALALLDQRRHITEEDWQLAGILWDTSVATRTWTHTQAATIDDTEHTDHARRAARRNALIGEELHAHDVDRVARRIALRVAETDDEWTRTAIARHVTSRDRHLIDDALTVACDRQWVTELADGLWARGPHTPPRKDP